MGGGIPPLQNRSSSLFDVFARIAKTSMSYRLKAVAVKVGGGKGKQSTAKCGGNMTARGDNFTAQREGRALSRGERSKRVQVQVQSLHRNTQAPEKKKQEIHSFIFPQRKEYREFGCSLYTQIQRMGMSPEQGCQISQRLRLEGGRTEEEGEAQVPGRREDAPSRRPLPARIIPTEERRAV